MKAYSGDPVAAWAPFQPGSGKEWNEDAAAHLYRRAGFGASYGEIERAVRQGPEKLVDRLLQPEEDVAAFDLEADGFESDGQNAKPLEELRGSWLRRMIATPDPLREKAALFWHSWFGVSGQRLQSPALALGHVRLLRSRGLGRCDALLEAAVLDPAVLVSAGGRENPKARPNLHLARQMLARYTVGEGQFSERDVSETARAFTGWFVRGSQLREVPREHDGGEKTILGQTGPWSARDFARIAAGHPAFQLRLVRGLCRWLISDQEDPPDDQLAPLVQTLSAEPDTGKLVGAMLKSKRFFARETRRARVKSPVEFAVGLCRAFESQTSAIQLGSDLADLGQDLYHPPTIKGWAGGSAWITPATLAGRASLAAALLSGPGPYPNRLDPLACARKYRSAQPAAAGDFLVRLLLQDQCPAEYRQSIRERLARASGGDLSPSLSQAAVLLAASPEYQLA